MKAAYAKYRYSVLISTLNSIRTYKGTVVGLPNVCGEGRAAAVAAGLSQPHW